jgi:hypothetical protein
LEVGLKGMELTDLYTEVPRREAWVKGKKNNSQILIISSGRGQKLLAITFLSVRLIIRLDYSCNLD